MAPWQQAKKRLLTSKSGLGSRLKGEVVCSQKRHKIGSPASETTSGAAPTTCLFFAVEFAGWGLASGVYSWGLAGCVWPPFYQFPWQYKRLLWPKIGGLQTHKQRFQSFKTVTWADFVPFLGAYHLTFEAAPQATFGSQEPFWKSGSPWRHPRSMLKKADRYPDTDNTEIR